MAMNPTFIQRVAQTVGARNKEKSRALPDSKGGETPKQLQTYRTEVFSYFTQPSLESALLYSAENWVVLKLFLETAGPVAVGTAASIVPVLSGHGILLDTDEEYVVTLSKGTRFYIASETINRVSVTIEPIPWLEQIDKDNCEGQQNLSSIEDIPCPPPPPKLIPRMLTGARSIRKMR